MPTKKKLAISGKKYGRPKWLMIFRKSLYMRRWLLRNPWIRPITVFTYATTRIQAWVRRFIIRSRIHRTGKPFPPKRIRRKVSKPRQLNRYLAYLDRFRDKPENKPEWLNTGFSTWCAVRIQASYRMHRIRRRFTFRNHLVNQVAAIVMQTFWKNCRYQLLDYIASQSLHGDDAAHPYRKDTPNPSSAKSALRGLQREDHAVFRIQRCWRAFCNRRIYRYFRDLIVERLSAAPIELLRNIIPNESAAFDRAAGTHVRFRLGGWIFPPKIFYKIYTHRPLCDVGAFAPRDYQEEKQESAAITNSKATSLQGFKTGRIKVGARFFDAVVTTTNPSGTKKWYKREENNGWRPIASQLFSTVKRPPWFQPEPIREKVKHFHFNSQYRKELKEKQRTKIKKRWMKKFFHSMQNKQSNSNNNNEFDPYNNDYNSRPESQNFRQEIKRSSSPPNHYQEEGIKHYSHENNQPQQFINSSSSPSLSLLLNQDRELTIKNRGNSGKARHGANYNRRDNPPVRLPGYLRKEDGVEESNNKPKNNNSNSIEFFHFDAASDLLNWSKALDYDDYVKEWGYVGCSRPSEYHISQQPALILGVHK